jgi:hypothetical protein
LKNIDSKAHSTSWNTGLAPPRVPRDEEKFSAKTELRHQKKMVSLLTCGLVNHYHAGEIEEKEV